MRSALLTIVFFAYYRQRTDTKGVFCWMNRERNLIINSLDRSKEKSVIHSKEKAAMKGRREKFLMITSFKLL